ncbi:nuclear transport factor 2 family protein [uncultured Sphingomonas sp.]|uniref:nuclear transport factor 2 family protein n=1 Tax=uncultured Sphingomonas sp. TaxID=158754 RepID=UPI00261EBEE9|nr:nuclear transport factor 2 family protein [uncultured Sphingomonas sp.]
MDLAVVDRLWDALAAGNVDAACDCLTPDARVWHSYDRDPQNVETTHKAWTGFVGAFPEREFTDIRRQPTQTGCVQQQTMIVRTQGGTRKAWPVCIVARIEDGRIARLDEYVDRAGSYDPDA